MIVATKYRVDTAVRDILRSVMYSDMKTPIKGDWPGLEHAFVKVPIASAIQE